MLQRSAVVGLFLLVACGSSSGPTPPPPTVTGTDIDPSVSAALSTALAGQVASLTGAGALAAQGAALALQGGVQSDSVTLTASALASPPSGQSEARTRSSALSSGAAQGFAFQLMVVHAQSPLPSTQVYSGVLVFQGATEAALAAGLSPGSTIPPSIGFILSAGGLWEASAGQQSAQFAEAVTLCPVTTLPAYVTACSRAVFTSVGFDITASTPLSYGATGLKTASLASTSMVGAALTLDCALASGVSFLTPLCGASVAIAVSVSPNTASVPTGGTKQFMANVTGTSNTAVNWTVDEASGGSVSSTGLYSAPGSTGTFHVRATSAADGTTYGEAVVTVSSASGISVSVSPGTASVSTGGTKQFMANVTGTSNTAVNWTVDEASGGSVSSTGLYSAPGSTGTFHVRATSAADGTTYGEAVVTVSTGSGVTVSVGPSAVTLPETGRAQFTATVTGASITSVNWSIDEGATGGTVSSAGLYTTAQTAGIFHVRATSTVDTSASGAAIVTVSGPAPAWVTAAGGVNSSAAVDADGGLWTWGYNGSYQLGNGLPASEQNLPGEIGTGFAAASLGTGFGFGVALTPAGALWGWGQGPLGLGVASSLEEVPVLLGTGFAKVSAGAYHVLAIKTDGTLWAWGDNSYGELGDGTQVAKNAPEQIGTATNWASVSAGYYYSMAVAADGTLWAWGDSTSGKLGIGVVVGGSPQKTPAEVGSGYASVAAGDYSTYAVKTDGSLWAWGYNGNGELGDGTTTGQSSPEQTGTGFASVAAGTGYEEGPAFGVAVTTLGELETWGDNTEGELGNGSVTGSLTHVMVGGGYSFVAAGQSWVLAIKTDGTLWGWGANVTGQLGIGVIGNQEVPVQIGP
ncbi:MAG: hypothetical protein ACLQIH_01045 [Myxococcaceae bacterium]